MVTGYGVWKFFRKKSTAHSPAIATTCPPSTVAFTLIGRQQFSQSETKSSSPSVASSMTRLSELQKGQEMVVVASRRLFPFSFQFLLGLAAVFAEEVGGFGLVVDDGKI